jgi:hypothetical protein
MPEIRESEEAVTAAQAGETTEAEAADLTQM